MNFRLLITVIVLGLFFLELTDPSTSFVRCTAQSSQQHSVGNDISPATPVRPAGNSQLLALLALPQRARPILLDLRLLTQPTESRPDSRARELPRRFVAAPLRLGFSSDDDLLLA